MKIALTGATGFTGSFVLPLLIKRGHKVRCLVRRAEAVGEVERQGAEAVTGDLSDPAALDRAFAGVDALVNVASMGFGHVDGLVDAACRAGVRRAVFVSTTAIFTSLNAPSKTMRLAAEASVQRSGLEWTILRPTMIYGTSRDRNIFRLIRLLRWSPVLPVFGKGGFLMQPIHVADLARAIVDSVAAQAAARRAYNLSGAAPLTYNELVRTVARLMGKRVWICHLPYKPAIRCLGFAERRNVRLPIKAEQILRLQEDKAFPSTDAQRDFGFTSRTFEAGVREELESLGLIARTGA